MYNPDDIFKTHKDIETDTMDDTTKSMYKNMKNSLYYVRGMEDRLNPAQKKYFKDTQEFCDGVEAGVIKHWWKYFKTADEIAREWEKVDTTEKFIEKMNKYYGKEIY